MTTPQPTTALLHLLRHPRMRVASLLLGLLALVLLLGYLVQHRQRTLEDLATSWPPLLLLGLAGVSAALLALHAHLLQRPAGHGSSSDLQRTLAALLSRVRGAHEIGELAALVTSGIQQALRLRHASLLVYDPHTGRVIDPQQHLQPLAAANNLLLLLSASSEPLPVNPRILEWLRRASPEDAVWLLDHEFALLVPVLGVDGSSLGLIALGPRSDGQPYEAPDHEALSALGDTVALTLEVWGRRPPSVGELPASNVLPGAPRLLSAKDSGIRNGLPATPGSARECLECGRLFSAAVEVCQDCECELDIALVPLVLPDKFRFERRLGTGGMGIVYLARDLSLHRDVAVKTLRRVSMEDAVRLRREARAAAAVHHQNLALIHGVESWSGAPMLILEYLPGGTLDDRLKQFGPLLPHQAIELVLAMASALERLHRASVLHRDLKPSNIGFAVDGTPKLMDFGIARLQTDLRSEATTAIGSIEDDAATLTGMPDSNPTSSTPRLIGTLHYLSPEATNGSPPSPAMDLWSLNVVLYECLTGKRLFNGTILQVLDAIRKSRIPDVREVSPWVPEPLAEYFQTALGVEAQRRPASAQALMRRLDDVRRELHE